jgi:hypothetical protein
MTLSPTKDFIETCSVKNLAFKNLKFLTEADPRQNWEQCVRRRDGRALVTASIFSPITQLCVGSIEPQIVHDSACLSVKESGLT